MSSTDSILQVSGISLSFKGVKAINELSFDIRRSPGRDLRADRA